MFEIPSTAIPDRLSIDKKDKVLYEKLKAEAIFNKENKDLFIMAMTYGYKNKVRTALETKEGYVRTEYLKPEDWALINSLAIGTRSVEILSKPEDICQLAEQYAHAGIKILAAKLDSTSFGSFEKQFEKELLEMYEKIDLDVIHEENTPS
jgi:hypothetical protein